jgi:hypothetical protein
MRLPENRTGGHIRKSEGSAAQQRDFSVPVNALCAGFRAQGALL